MELLKSLNIDTSAVLVNIVGFVLLWIVARKLVFLPIGLLLTERQQDISKTYDQLDADRKEMATLKADYEQRLTAIEAEAREKIQGAIRDAQSARDQILNEANTRSREMITRAEQEVNHEREQAMITLREQVVNLAMGAATRVIGEGLDEKRQRKLISDFITAPDSNFSTSTGQPTFPEKPGGDNTTGSDREEGDSNERGDSGEGGEGGVGIVGAATIAAAAAATAAVIAGVASAVTEGKKNDAEDLSVLESLKPSAAKSAVRSGLRATRKTATDEGGAASGQPADTDTADTSAEIDAASELPKTAGEE